MMKGISLYTVARCKHKQDNPLNKDEIFNVRHASHDAEQTLCLKTITDGMWYITDNSFEGEVNCALCLRNHKITQDQL